MFDTVLRIVQDPRSKSQLEKKSRSIRLPTNICQLERTDERKDDSKMMAQLRKLCSFLTFGEVFAIRSSCYGNTYKVNGAGAVQAAVWSSQDA